MSEMKNWRKLMGIYCHGNSFDLSALKEQLENPKYTRGKLFEDEYKSILGNRTIDIHEYVKITDIEFDDNDDLYDYLEEVFRFLFADGSLDAVDAAYEGPAGSITDG